MFFGIALVSLALIFYTLAVWAEQIKGSLAVWMVCAFAGGFACDFLGTSIMSWLAPTHASNLHTCCGLAALLIMFLHLIWALLALKKSGRTRHFFHQYSVYAWGIWLVAFLTGAFKQISLH
ncbi:TIGR03987 family protein [Candidatus Parcubacteria bacterium]|jgi:uncharacterized repeat protein (TIGR03987 family)|nr:MAG: TIGR03987 family protein [Candidatus Parcubacteria bacterium]